MNTIKKMPEIEEIVLLPESIGKIRVDIDFEILFGKTSPVWKTVDNHIDDIVRKNKFITDKSIELILLSEERFNI